MVSMKSVKIVDLDETIRVFGVVQAVCGLLGNPNLEILCQLFTRYGNTKIAVLRLPVKDAESLIQVKRVKIVWINCRIRVRVAVKRYIICPATVTWHAAAVSQTEKKLVGGAAALIIRARIVKAKLVV